jgi:L-amino acid N-acyltransferase YncA
VLVRLAATREDLQDILSLQRENHRDHVSPGDAEREGFVTVAHTLEALEQMHALAPSVVAREGDALAGYALTMPLEARDAAPVLAPMFAQFDALSWQGRPLSASRYYVMGQVCVARAFRGQGVFDALYRGHREAYAPRFDFIVTEIATRNARSMRAHARVGFQVISTYRDALDEWAVVLWDWR